jgi:hypothetical protein
MWSTRPRPQRGVCLPSIPVRGRYRSRQPVSGDRDRGCWFRPPASTSGRLRGPARRGCTSSAWAAHSSYLTAICSSQLMGRWYGEVGASERRHVSARIAPTSRKSGGCLVDGCQATSSRHACGAHIGAPLGLVSRASVERGPASAVELASAVDPRATRSDCASICRIVLLTWSPPGRWQSSSARRARRGCCEESQLRTPSGLG